MEGPNPPTDQRFEDREEMKKAVMRTLGTFIFEIFKKQKRLNQIYF